MKLRALVGTETLVCMAAMFAGARGAGTHDINFILPLLEKVKNRFALRYLLADKAYLSENVVGSLAAAGIQAVIPIKKRWDGKGMKRFYEAFHHLVVWYDERQTDFHEKYRLRPKIESFFSLVKNMADGYCWSRGRRSEQHKKNADGPCTAWINETLCKLIYVNLRQIVHYEFVTGYRMNLLTDTFFPNLPFDKLIE
jgi:hypothetical protein